MTAAPDLPAPLRAVAALAAGSATGLAFAPTGWWPLALVGLAALTVLVSGRTLRGAAGLGYLFGVGLCAVSVSWLSGLGWWIALLLVVAMACFSAGYAFSARLALEVPGWPVWLAACWSLSEFVACRFPFGGFGWLRLAYTVVDSPLSGLLPVVGVPGVSFAVVLLAQLLAWAVLRRGTWLRRLLPLVVALAVLMGLGAWGRGAMPSDDDAEGRVTVGIVQGNINGVDPLEPFGRARTVTQNHLSETVGLFARARAGAVPMPDLVLWPENSTDVDPLLDAQTNAIVSTASTVADVPILVGAVLEGPGEDERQTAGLWWEPGGDISARYLKRNLVPFGEFIPFRDALLPHVPILELVGAQSVPGTEPGALPVSLPDGRKVVLGDVICFELAWDSTVREAVTNGAQVLMVQSNNASYGGTAQIGQQWQITRARAMETGRDVAVATTNSLSGVIRADGTVVTRSAEFEAWSTSQSLALRSGLTPAMKIAPVLELVLAGLGLLASAAGFLARALKSPLRRR